MRGSRGSAGKRRRGDDAPGEPVHTFHQQSARALGLSVDENEQPRRLSRHIPHRVGMDMELASYNLTDTGVAPTSMLGCASTAAAAAGAADTSGNGGSSFLSDDSTYMASLYKERLASSLVPGAAKIGGEVLRFGAERHGKSSATALARATTSKEQSTAGHPPSAALVVTSRLGGTAAASSHSGPKSRRIVCPNPERVLDAPELPRNASHMIDWGSNNRIAIGIRSTLYEYDPVTNDARKIVELPPTSVIRSVHWFFKCSCVCMGMLTEPVANFFDMRAERFIRNLQVPGSAVSAIAVNGSTAAIGNSSGNVFVYDLRSRDPLVATLEAHRDRVTALDYRIADPSYLASGGTDGVVKVWDDRKRGFPVYTLDRVHQPTAAVTAIYWNPEKRTTLFSGDSNGMLHLLDTHKEAAPSPQQSSLEPPGHGVSTGSGITGIVAAAGSGEVATAHRNPGQIQVRRVGTFQHVATFSSQSSQGEPITSMTLSPDRERVCAAQLDETLKFWKIFEDPTAGKNGPRRPLSNAAASQFHDELR
jgi:hypothetical protein